MVAVPLVEHLAIMVDLPAAPSPAVVVVVLVVPVVLVILLLVVLLVMEVPMFMQMDLVFH